IAFHWENMFTKPRQQLAFTSGYRGVLGEMGVAVDQSRKNGDVSVIDPFNRDAFLSTSQVIIIPNLQDHALVNNDRAFPVGPDRPHFRGVDQKPAEPKRFIFHDPDLRAQHTKPLPGKFSWRWPRPPADDLRGGIHGT